MISLFIRILLIFSFSLTGSFLMPGKYLGGVIGGILAIALLAWEYWKKSQLILGCKILDTSVVVDGRIADIGKAGFLEGTYFIPVFVLHELQRITDSTDVLKRNRGRRGLDTLDALQRIPGITAKILQRDYPDILAVDEKLLRLAKQLGGKLITNDVNLNKMAGLQGIPVANLNNLSNAVKTVVLPGEEMMVKILKDGKEPGQGVGYLDDGTMVVVENGGGFLNQKQVVSVTSVLQTAAGRMIFAKVKSGGKA